MVPAISNKYLTLFEVASNHLGDVDTDKFVFSNDDLAKCFGSPETEYDHRDLATELVEDIQFMNGAADEEKVAGDLAACGYDSLPQLMSSTSSRSIHGFPATFMRLRKAKKGSKDFTATFVFWCFGCSRPRTRRIPSSQ